MEKPFREFKCKIHGYGWLYNCEGCVEQNRQFYEYYDGVIKPLKRYEGGFLFPKCQKCGMRYVHDLNHSGKMGWRKEWVDRLVGENK